MSLPGKDKMTTNTQSRSKLLSLYDTICLEINVYRYAQLETLKNRIITKISDKIILLREYVTPFTNSHIDCPLLCRGTN